MNNFTVFVLNCYNEVTTVCRFSNKEIPSTLQQFWLATGVDERISNYGKARVRVSMEEGWSKLDANPKSTVKYIFDSRNGAMFQLSPFHTPTSSPLDGADKEGVEKVETQFRGVVEELFKPNPFANGIPSVYEDTTLQKLRAFFQRQPDEHNTTDSDVLALILAMPGSGKTRTVVEAARGKKYHRFRMSNRTFENADSLQEFLQKTVLSTIPNDGEEVVVVHFDEIQALMVTPEGCEESLVATLSKAIDSMVNGQHPPRSWLKFVLTGTNIFTRTSIKIGADVKALPIALDGSFSIEFVSELANVHGINNLLVGTNYLERCRHNRRFTERFFSFVWDGSKTDGFNIEGAYRDAFELMKEQMSNQFRGGVPVSQVACSVFAKILAVPQDEVDSGVVFLRNCSKDEKAYIAGGGLNVCAIGDEGISIYYPTGFVLEVLEALLGRAASYAAGRTVTAFLRVHSVCGFGVKGHLFEWLIAHDISCPRSEFDRVMEPYAGRHDSCIGAEAISGAQVYDLIFDANAVPGIWVVRDTHRNNEDRWVDVAYSIKVSDPYKEGFALIECKTGYKKTPQRLHGFYDEFIKKAVKLAHSHHDTCFVAVFACEREFENQDLTITLPDNLTTIVQTITNERCPMISKFLGADPTDDDNNDTLARRLSRPAVSQKGADS